MEQEREKQPLFAWRDSAPLPLVDHTWVTTYRPASGLPDPALGDYWYCWGVPHPEAHELCSSDEGAEFARMIAEPNNRSSTVGIRYGIDGVCHQMANRLLRFATDPDGLPQTVSDARGYQLSVGMYGVYGGKSVLLSSQALPSFEKQVEEYKEQLAKSHE